MAAWLSAWSFYSRVRFFLTFLKLLMKSAHCILLIYFHCVWYSTLSHMFSLNFFSLLNIKRSKNISVSTALILTWKHIRFLALLLNILRNSFFFFKENKNENNKLFFFFEIVYLLYILGGRFMKSCVSSKINLYCNLHGHHWNLVARSSCLLNSAEILSDRT